MDPGNGSPIATNVVLVLVLVGVLVVCYQIFKVLKLIHFATDRNQTFAYRLLTILLHCVGFSS